MRKALPKLMWARDPKDRRSGLMLVKVGTVESDRAVEIRALRVVKE
jgi:hypothetical protein